MPNQSIKLEQIAKLAGVSRTTASYVINGKSTQHRISEATQQKVMTVVQQYNYQPNRAAATLRAGQSHSIGLIVPDLASNCHVRLASVLERSTRQQGLQLLISCSDDSAETEKIVVSNLLNRRVDGLLVITSLAVDDPFYRQIQDQGTPVIGLSRRMPGEGFASVESEYQQSIRRLLSRLIDNTSLQVTLLGEKSGLEATPNIELVLREVLSESNSWLEVVYSDSPTPENSTEIADKSLQNTGFPDLMIITSCELFDGLIEYMIHLPDSSRKTFLEKTHMILLDESRLVNFLPIRLTALSHQYELLACKALELAQEAIKGHYQRGSVLLPRILKFHD